MGEESERMTEPMDMKKLERTVVSVVGSCTKLYPEGGVPTRRSRPNRACTGPMSS